MIKLKHLSAILITTIILSSCAEKVKICKLDRETLNGQPYIQYIYENDKLVRAEIYDSSGYAGKYIWTRNGSGVITNVDVFFTALDSLSHSNTVFMNSSGKIDSVQTYVDSDGNNTPDYLSSVHIYHYTGDKITTVDRRIPTLPTELYLTITYSGNDISELDYEGGNKYTYTYSNVEDLYAKYIYVENMVSEPGPSIMSEHYATHRDKFNSSWVLQTSVDYTITQLSDGGAEIYYPSTLSTRQFLTTCTEQ